MFQPSPLNEKVLREKRKKLKETFDRVMRLYVSKSLAYNRTAVKYNFIRFQNNDDPELWAELKRKEVEYEKRRNKKVHYFESVKHAQTVQVDEIPLPQMVTATSTTAELPNGPPNMFAIPGRIPLPNTLPPVLPLFSTAPPTLAAHLKKPPPVLVEASGDKVAEKKKKEPPGCPPGPPPSLLDMAELDSDYDEDEAAAPPPAKVKRTKSQRFADTDAPAKVDASRDEPPKGVVVVEPEVLKPTSLQQRMLAISGQNIDEFMKEMEHVQKKKEQERFASLQERLSTLEKEGGITDAAAVTAHETATTECECYKFACT